MRRQKKIGLLVLAFSSISALASCGQKEKPHVHEFVDHEEVLPTCVDAGNEAYKTCTGCDKYFNEDGEEIASPVVIPVDPNDHKGTKQLVLSGDYKTSYVVGDTFDLDNAVFTVKCEHCQGSALSKAKKEKIEIAYPTSGATSFTVSDLKSSSLTLNFTYSGLSTSVKVTLGKKSNAITGLSAISKTCGFKPFSSLEGVDSTYGDIVYSFSDAQDGEYKTAEQLGEDYSFKADTSSQSKTFYVKAEVAEGEDYLGASEATTVTISHNGKVWDTSGTDKDVFGCSCSPDVVFSKKTSSTQILDLSASSVSLSLDGSGYDSSKGHTIEKISYVAGKDKTYDLGNSLSALTISDDLKADVEHHGEATLDVVVKTPASGEVPECEHHVSAKVKLADALLYNNPTSFDVIKPLCSTKSDHSVEGYYVLMEDICLNVFNGKNADGTGTGTSWGRYDGTWADADGDHEFRGTLDGNGKTIAGQSTFNGLFCKLEGATVKDLTLTEQYWREFNKDDFTYSLLAASMKNTTLENVKIKINGGSKLDPFKPDLSKPIGFLCRMRFMSNTLRNVDIDASEWNIPVVFASNNGNDNAFENCSLKVGTYGYLWSHWKAGKVTAWDGLTIEGSVYSAS